MSTAADETALSSMGYSKRSLAEKLGFKPGMAVAFVALPPRLGALASSVAFSSASRASGWGKLASSGASFDVIHAFAKTRSDLEIGLAELQRAIKRDGAIWVSWPKKTSAIATDLSDQAVRAEALKLDLVDVKVAAIDDDWSGLKLVIRRDRR